MKPSKLLLINIVVLLSLHCLSINATAEVEWQREYGATVNGEYVSGAFTGGLSRSKPSFVDIDGDGDYDMFIGGNYYDRSINGYYGNIHFYRNDGSPASPLWTFITGNYNSIDVGGYSTPTFVDIDFDGDYDMFVGGATGYIHFYRNDGTLTSPSWTFVTSNYNSINVKYSSAPAFCDIDSDGDYDMFVGGATGYIHFYRNDGTPTSPSWTFVTSNYNSINVRGYSTPTFRDIDSDGDYDMFIGGFHGNINFYQNDGTPASPSWTFVTSNYNSINVKYSSAPAFCDIDSDGDYDMFIGEWDGNVNFYQNDGTPASPSWTLATRDYNPIDVGWGSTPTFVDIDSDGDYDMFIGNDDGNITFYQNEGTPVSPSWTFVTDFYNSIDVGYSSTPTFVDIDFDGDYDMFIGNHGPIIIDQDYTYGFISFYRNDGTPASPSWTFVTGFYNSIDVRGSSAPAFCDIDSDGDYDMFIGNYYGNIHFYRNDGSPASPLWTFITGNYNSIDVGYSSAPTFRDIDSDGDYDIFVGEEDGNINVYQNNGTPISPSWTFVSALYNLIDVGGFSAPTFVDIDSDGDYDMFIGEEGGGINFWRNITGENTPPTAHIVSITPRLAYEGKDVSFVGSATDPNEGDTIVAYEWTSSKDGLLSEEASFTTTSLSGGYHTISFNAQDNHSAWSNTASRGLWVVKKMRKLEVK